jgi:hypothetical protein
VPIVPSAQLLLELRQCCMAGCVVGRKMGGQGIQEVTGPFEGHPCAMQRARIGPAEAGDPLNEAFLMMGHRAQQTLFHLQRAQRWPEACVQAQNRPGPDGLQTLGHAAFLGALRLPQVAQQLLPKSLIRVILF